METGLKPIKEFSTYDVDLASYLMFSGLKFIECKLDDSPGAKARVLMRFFDEKEIARDLERNFVNSESKKFREYNKYLLRQIHMTLKGIIR